MNFFYLDFDLYLESGVFPIPSPLEQFEIIPFLPMKIGDLYFSFTNPSLFMLLTLSLVRVQLFFYLDSELAGALLCLKSYESIDKSNSNILISNDNAP